MVPSSRFWVLKAGLVATFFIISSHFLLIWHQFSYWFWGSKVHSTYNLHTTALTFPFKYRCKAFLRFHQVTNRSKTPCMWSVRWRCAVWLNFTTEHEIVCALLLPLRWRGLILSAETCCWSSSWTIWLQRDIHRFTKPWPTKQKMAEGHTEEGYSITETKNGEMPARCENVSSSQF